MRQFLSTTPFHRSRDERSRLVCGKALACSGPVTPVSRHANRKCPCNRVTCTVVPDYGCGISCQSLPNLSSPRTGNRTFQLPNLAWFRKCNVQSDSLTQHRNVTPNKWPLGLSSVRVFGVPRGSARRLGWPDSTRATLTSNGVCWDALVDLIFCATPALAHEGICVC